MLFGEFAIPLILANHEGYGFIEKAMSARCDILKRMQCKQFIKWLQIILDTVVFISIE